MSSGRMHDSREGGANATQGAVAESQHNLDDALTRRSNRDQTDEILIPPSAFV